MDLDWAPRQRRAVEPAAQERFRDLVQSELLTSFRNEPPFYDEPKPWVLSGSLHLPPHLIGDEPDLGTREFGFAGSCSFERTVALNRLCGEAVERFVLLPPSPSGIRRSWSSFGAGMALDPQRVVAGLRREPPKRQSIDLEWIEATDLSTGSQVHVPTQLVNVPHLFVTGEPVLRAPITTGAAVAWSEEEAVFRGLAEVIERDSFMVNWLLGPTGRRIPVDALKDENSDSRLSAGIDECRRYRLEPVFIQLFTPELLQVVACALFDRSGIGPYFSLGASASYSVHTACQKALEEALQLRIWLRSDHTSIVEFAKAAGDSRSPKTIRSRAALCFDQDYAELLRGMLDLDSSIPIADLRDGPRLRDVISQLVSSSASVYAVDLTDRMPPALAELGLRATKVVVPELQPLYLTESLADVAWRRLELYQRQIPSYRRDELNEVPHPFL